MLIAVALIELDIPDADSIKAKRRVVRSVKDRLRRKFNVSVAEVADHDDRHSVCIGCTMVGVDSRYIREGMEKALRYVDSLGFGELVADDIVVVRLDELEEADEAEIEVPTEWSND